MSVELAPPQVTDALRLLGAFAELTSDAFDSDAFETGCEWIAFTVAVGLAG